MDTRPRIVSTRGEGFGSSDHAHVLHNEYDHEYNEAAREYSKNSGWQTEQDICREHEEKLKKHPEIRNIETIITLND